MKFIGPANNNYLGEFIFCSRINDWLHTLGLTVLGIVFYSSASLLTLPALAGLAISILYLAHGFSLNNYFDIAIDQHINKNYIPASRLPGKKFLVFSYFLLLVNFFLACLISLKLAALIIAGSILALIYSAPPFRFKKYTYLNIILNSAGFAIIFLIGFISVSGKISLAAAMMSGLFAILFIPLQIIHQIAHSKADQVENILTVFNRYGLRPTLYLSCLSLAGLALWSLLFSLINAGYIGVFYLTCLFCFLFILSLQRIKKSKKPYPLAAAELRIFLRKICILYGVVLSFIFYFAS